MEFGNSKTIDGIKTVAVNDVILAAMNHNRGQIFGLSPWASSRQILQKRKQQRGLERTASDAQE